MKRVLAAMGALLLVPVFARGRDWRDNGGFFDVYAGPVSQEPGVRSGATIGFGGEVFIYKGWAAEIDSELVPLFSLGSAYHFLRHRGTSNLDPYLIGGYTVICCGDIGVHHGVHFGAGLDYWFLSRLGVRGEWRDVIINDPLTGGVVNRAELRMGFVFNPPSLPGLPQRSRRRYPPPFPLFPHFASARGAPFHRFR